MLIAKNVSSLEGCVLECPLREGPLYKYISVTNCDYH